MIKVMSVSLPKAGTVLWTMRRCKGPEMLKNVKPTNMHNRGIKKPQQCIQGFTNYTMKYKFKQVKKFSLKIKRHFKKTKAEHT